MKAARRCKEIDAQEGKEMQSSPLRVEFARIMAYAKDRRNRERTTASGN